MLTPPRYGGREGLRQAETGGPAPAEIERQPIHDERRIEPPIVEPGRVIAGPAGILLTRVIWVKPGATHPFVIVDAAMNDLACPALYDAFHRFAAVVPCGSTMTANIAGHVCETGDTFAMGRTIDRVRRGDLAVLHAAGA